MESGQTVEQYSDFIVSEVVRRLESQDVQNVVHAIWYCIDGSGARLQSADAKIISTLDENALVLVTKTECMRKQEISTMQNSLLDLIPKQRVVMISSFEKTGLSLLLSHAKVTAEVAAEKANVDLNSFQKRWQEYYLNMYRDWETRTGSAADSFIHWATGRAAAIAIIPLPMADVAPLLANEAYMIYRLGNIYGYAVDKTIFTMLAGVASGSFAGKLLASFLPGLKIAIAAGITYGVGKAAKAYFKSGMNLSVKELKEEFIKGEKEAKKTNWEKHQQQE